MPLATTVLPDQIEPCGQVVRPVSQVCNWRTCHTAPNTQDGNPVTDPGALSSSAIAPIAFQGSATTLAVRCVYPSGASISTSPIVQLFGKDANAAWEHLPDANGILEVTLPASANDAVVKTGFKATQAKLFDLRGNSLALVAIRTALAGTGITGSYLEFKAF